ncbi:MAG: RNB domain-containing ribonuclease [Rhodococcus sp.]|nr:RNB domain-containing ribonuclease [Rhodococcus sp. (in: high G+C Gram-positive bacteria)]
MQEADSATDRYAKEREDRTDLALVTIDPPGSKDLDQALHIARTDTGYVLHYAIADVGAVVEPGGALDRETRKRGQTLYLPDGSIPLHPRELSEGSASLLPDQTRPAALWHIELDVNAEPVSWSVTRALVRSVARFDYATVQSDADSGRLHPSLTALPEFGKRRMAAAITRGAIELKLPEQEVVEDANSTWRVAAAVRTEADDWNAEVSLLTGMCAASMMIEAKVGLLRTLPPAEPGALADLRKTALALGIAWPDGAAAGEILAGLDPNDTATLALMSEAPKLLRGADYAAFDGTVPELFEHSAIAAPYAHVTAPLRRLSDRFTTEVCLAISADSEIPAWAREALPTLPDLMSGSDSLSNKVDRACIDRTEATMLEGRVGEVFEATILRSRENKRAAEVFVSSVMTIAKCAGDPKEGEHAKVRLTTVDVDERKVEFTFPA